MRRLFLIVFLAALIVPCGMSETITDPSEGSKSNKIVAHIDPLSLLLVTALGKHLVAAQYESRLPSTEPWRISPQYLCIDGVENVGLTGGTWYIPPNVPRPLFIETAIGLSVSIGYDSNSPSFASAWWGWSVLSRGLGPAATCPRKAGLAIQILNRHQISSRELR